MRAQAIAAIVVLWSALYHTAIGSAVRSVLHFDVRPVAFYFPSLGAEAPAVHAALSGEAPGPDLAWGRALSQALAQLPSRESNPVRAELAARGFKGAGEKSFGEKQLQLASRVFVAEAGSDDAAALSFFCGDALMRFARERALAESGDASVEEMFAALPPGACPAGSAALTAMTLLTAYRLRWPLVRAAAVTSGFGPRMHPLLGEEKMHTGIDIGVADGTRVLAAGTGEVARADVENGFGGRVALVHGHGVTTSYAHLSRWNVFTGERVLGGEAIATSGHSGNVTGPHLHFQVEIGGSAVDPLKIVAP